MRRIRLELCYDGAEYSGWQIQPNQANVKTVQGELQKAIRRVGGEDVDVLGSGRTDAGVHAFAQTAAFDTESTIPQETLAKAINAFLPPDIRIWRAFDVAPDFHPIRDVLRKRYRYLVSDSRPAFPFFRKYAWLVFRPLDLELMRRAASALLGEHDFSAFQTQGSPRKTTVRTIYDVVVKRAPLDVALSFPRLTDTDLASSTPKFPGAPELTLFEVEADGFLYNMVRAIVGTLKLFGERRRGYDDPEFMREIVASADRRKAGPTAPPHGLYMIDVVYPSDARAKS